MFGPTQKTRELEQQVENYAREMAAVVQVADKGNVIETTATQLSFRDVLYTRERIGHITRMHELATTLGYPYFIWNDRVYSVGAAGFSDSGLTIGNVL